MLKRLAPLRGGAHYRKALGRVIAVALLATAVSFAGSEKISVAEMRHTDPFNQMNLKLYLHNQINDWDQFECANQLAYRESGWRYWAVNKRSGARGIFQSMSSYAKHWDPFMQIDKAIIYIDSRYDGSWCAALTHLEEQGWH